MTQETMAALWSSLVQQKPNLLRVLTMLSEKDMSFYDISKAVGALRKKKKQTGVHGTIVELMTLGLIVVTKEEPFEKIPGVVKKWYGLTETGRLLLREDIAKAGLKLI